MKQFQCEILKVRLKEQVANPKISSEVSWQWKHIMQCNGMYGCMDVWMDLLNVSTYNDIGIRYMYIFGLVDLRHCSIKWF